MERFVQWLWDFWIDETDYYGDTKACIILLAFQALLLVCAIAVYLIRGCGITSGCPPPIF